MGHIRPDEFFAQEVKVCKTLFTDNAFIEET